MPVVIQDVPFVVEEKVDYFEPNFDFRVAELDVLLSLPLQLGQSSDAVHQRSSPLHVSEPRLVLDKVLYPLYLSEFAREHQRGGTERVLFL